MIVDAYDCNVKECKGQTYLKAWCITDSGCKLAVKFIWKHILFVNNVSKNKRMLVFDTESIFSMKIYMHTSCKTLKLDAVSGFAMIDLDSRP